MLTKEFNITFTNQYQHSPNTEFVFLDLEDTQDREYSFYKKVDDSSWTCKNTSDENNFKEGHNYTIKEYPNGLVNALDIEEVL